MHYKPKIMIADDIQMIRRTLKTALIRAGMTGIVEARNGKEVVAQLKEDKFDLVICDWEMPEMTGIETLRYVRQDEQHKDTPFVMVTSVADPDHIRQAIIEGVTDYIVKPVKPDLFVGKVMFLLRRFYENQKQDKNRLTIKKWVIS